MGRIERASEELANFTEHRQLLYAARAVPGGGQQCAKVHRIGWSTPDTMHNHGGSFSRAGTAQASFELA